MFPPKPEEHKLILESMDEVKELLCRLLGRLIDVREKLSNLAGVGHDTFTKSEYVLDNGTEEQKERLRTGEAKPHTLYTEVKLAEANANGITSQVCSYCGIEKPLEEFDGGRTRCNSCRALAGHRKEPPHDG